MRPTFLGFETARKGMMVSQKGLDITGHNLSNMYTAGYTRQRVDLVSVAPNSFRTRYASSRVDFAGQGSDINGISQTRDQFLDKRFRDTYGEVGYYEQARNILADIESAVSEKGGTGLQDALTAITKALETFTGDATSVTNANILATNFKSMTQLFHQFDTKLNNVAEQQQADLQNSVTYVNELFTKIAQLNETIADDIGISRENDSEYYGPNELMDQRNLMIDELSKYGDIDVQTLANGSVTVKMNGKTVVDHKKATQIIYTKNDQKGTVKLNWQDDGKSVVLSKGALKASMEFINGRGPNVTASDEGSEKGVLYYKDRLDTFAQTLATQMNKMVLVDPDAPVVPPATPVYKQLFGARVLQGGTYVTSATEPVTAGNISLSDAWLEDSSFVMQDKDSKDNQYLQNMLKALKSDNTIDFVSNGETFTGTFEQYLLDYTTMYASDVSFNENRLTATAEIADDLNNRRSSVSGVSEIEETTNMMTYSKSYQASARLMTALDEALDILINKTGLVGR